MRRTATLTFWLAGLLLSLFGSSVSEAGSRTDQLLGQIGDSKPANRNLQSALDVLRTQIDKTRRELPSGLTNEFEQSVPARLQAIQAGVTQNIVPEYKNALMAKRILELSENVLTLPYRKIPEDAQPRKEAQQQYAAVRERFEKAALDKVKHLDEPSRAVISGALHQELTDVQQDIFRPGYGQPLGDLEKTELNGIVDRILETAAGLPAAENKRNQPSGLHAAARVANDGRQALLKFLRGREAGLAKNQSFVSAFKKWRNEIASLEQAIDRDLKNADEAEVKAVIERARRQGEKDIQENNPRRVVPPSLF